MCQNNKDIKIEKFSKEWWSSQLKLDEIKIIPPEKTEKHFSKEDFNQLLSILKRVYGKRLKDYNEFSPYKSPDMSMEEYYNTYGGKPKYFQYGSIYNDAISFDFFLDDLNEKDKQDITNILNRFLGKFGFKGLKSFNFYPEEEWRNSKTLPNSNVRIGIYNNKISTSGGNIEEIKIQRQPKIWDLDKEGIDPDKVIPGDIFQFSLYKQGRDGYNTVQQIFVRFNSEDKNMLVTRDINKKDLPIDKGGWDFWDKNDIRNYWKRSPKNEIKLDEIKLFNPNSNLGKLIQLTNKWNDIIQKFQDVNEIYGNNSAFVRHFGENERQYHKLDHKENYSWINRTEENKEWSNDIGYINNQIKGINARIESLKRDLRNHIKLYYKEKQFYGYRNTDFGVIELKKIFEKDLGGEEIFTYLEENQFTSEWWNKQLELDEIKLISSNNINNQTVLDKLKKLGSIKWNGSLSLDFDKEFDDIKSKYRKNINLYTDLESNQIDKNSLINIYKDLSKLENKWHIRENLEQQKLDRSSLIKEFIKDCFQELNINDKEVKIKLTKDKSKTKTYAHFDPQSKEVVVYTGTRSLGDILRSLSHEIKHLSQLLNGELKPKSGETGSKEENDANSFAGVMLRNFGEKYPMIFESKKSKEELLNEIKIINPSTKLKLPDGYNLNSSLRGKPKEEIENFIKNFISINPVLNKYYNIAKTIKPENKSIEDSVTNIINYQYLSEDMTWVIVRPIFFILLNLIASVKLGEEIEHELKKNNYFIDEAFINNITYNQKSKFPEYEKYLNNIQEIKVVKPPKIYDLDKPEPRGDEIVNNLQPRDIIKAGYTEFEIIDKIGGFINYKVIKGNHKYKDDKKVSIHSTQMIDEIGKYREGMNFIYNQTSYLFESLKPEHQEALDKIIKGFELYPYEKGFKNAYLSKNAKASPKLAEQINKFLHNKLKVTDIKFIYDPYYQTVNLAWNKLEEIKVLGRANRETIKSLLKPNSPFRQRIINSGYFVDIVEKYGYGKYVESGEAAKLFNNGQTPFENFVDFSLQDKDLNSLYKDLLNPDKFINEIKVVSKDNSFPYKLINLINKVKKHYNEDDLKYFERIIKKGDLLEIEDLYNRIKIHFDDNYNLKEQLDEIKVIPGGLYTRNFIDDYKFNTDFFRGNNAKEAVYNCIKVNPYISENNIVKILVNKFGYSDSGGGKVIKDALRRINFDRIIVKNPNTKRNTYLYFIKDNINEIKISKPATHEMIIDLVDKLWNEHWDKIVELRNKYQIPDGIIWPTWLDYLSQNDLNEFYNNLLSFKNKPIQEQFTKEWWSEQLELNEIKILSGITPQMIHDLDNDIKDEEYYLSLMDTDEFWNDNPYEKYGYKRGSQEGFGDFLNKLNQKSLNSLYQDILDWRKRWNIKEVKIINRKSIPPINETWKYEANNKEELYKIIEFLYNCGYKNKDTSLEALTSIYSIDGIFRNEYFPAYAFHDEINSWNFNFAFSGIPENNSKKEKAKEYKTYKLPLNEIKIYGKDQFPKNIDWVYKINNNQEGKKIAKLLDQLEYIWNGDNNLKIDYNDTNDPNYKFKLGKFPLYIFWNKNNKGITYTQFEDTLEHLLKNEKLVKLNF